MGVCPSHLLYIQLSKACHRPTSHFFNKKTSQSANYNKNGCKFARRVKIKEYYSIGLSSRAGARDLQKAHIEISPPIVVEMTIRCSV